MMPGEFYIEGKKQKLDLAAILAAAGELEAKLDSIVVYRGETTAPGAADGSTLICSDLTSQADYNGNTVVILSGTYAGQARVINGSTVGGTVTPDSAFGGQIIAGARFAILSIRSPSVDLSPLAALIDAVEGKLDSPVFGLAALKALLDALELQLDVPRPPPYEFWASSAPVIKSVGGDSQRFAISLSTIDGPPVPDDIVEGVISIWRVRATATDLMVDAQPCSKDMGLIYFDYSFINGTWLEGDVYRALFEGQAIVIGGIEFALPPIVLQGIVSESATIAIGSATGNWQTAETDVITIGADNLRRLLQSLLLSIHNLVGTAVTVRMYMQINMVERKVYEQSFNAGTDPPGLWIVNGSVGMHDALRVTLQSNNAADNGKSVDVDYILEGMA